jgi:hypothetical protein
MGANGESDNKPKTWSFVPEEEQPAAGFRRDFGTTPADHNNNNNNYNNNNNAG